MRYLIPHHIRKQLHAGERRGEAQAVVISLVLPSWRRLQRIHPPRLAREQAARGVGDLLNPIIGAVHAAHGTLVDLLTDPLTLLFLQQDGEAPASTAARALHALGAIQAHYARRKRPMPVWAGVAAGDVTWAIVRDGPRAAFSYGGVPLASALVALHALQAPGTGVHHTARPLVAVNGVALQKTTLGVHTTADRLPPLEPTPPRPMPPALTAARAFVGPTAASCGGAPTVETVTTIAIAFRTLEEGAAPFIAALRHLGHVFQALLQPVQRRGTLGEAMLLMEGDPRDAPERALQLLQALHQQQWSHHWSAAVHRGPAWLGLLGTTTRSSYGAVGVAATLPRLLAPLGEAQAILATSAIVEAVDERFAWQKDGVFRLQGLPERTATFRLRHTYLRHLPAPFREPLTAQREAAADLLQASSALDAGQSAGVAYVYGPAGSGKSHLLHTVADALRDQHDALVVTCPSSAADRTALAPFRRGLRAYFQQDRSAPPAANRLRFRRTLDLLHGRLRLSGEKALAEELWRLRSLLAALVGLRQPDSLYEQMTPALRQVNLAHAVRTLLQVEARHRPVVIVADEAQWFDNASRRLLDALLHDGDTPLLVLAAVTTTTEAPPWQIYAHDGLPVRSLALPANAALQTPAWRELAEPLRATLLAAAVLGTRFSPAVLRLLLPATLPLPAALAEGCRAGFWYRTPTGDYQFTQGSFPAAVAAKLPETIAQSLHAAAAQALLNTWQYEAPSFAGRIAAHWVAAAISEPAVTWFITAAEQALAHCDDDTARDAIRRALALLPPEERNRRYELLTLREQIHARNVELDAWRLDLQTLEKLLPTGAAQRAARGALLLRLGRFFLAGDSAERARRAGSEARLLGEANNDVGLRAQAQLLEAEALAITGDSYAAWSGLEQAYLLARDARLHHVEAETLDHLARQTYDAGLFGEAIAYGRRALTLWQQLEYTSGEAKTLLLLGAAELANGAARPAHEFFHQARLLYLQFGDQEGDAQANLGLGRCALISGAFETALSRFETALSAAYVSRQPIDMGWAQYQIGVTYHRLGSYLAARARYRLALHYFQEAGADNARAHAAASLALLLLHEGDSLAARRFSARSAALARSAGDAVALGRALTTLGYALVAGRKLAEAEVAFAQAVEQFAAVQQEFLGLEALAGQLRIARFRRRPRAAAPLVTRLIQFIENGSVLMADEPLRIFLIVYEAMRALGDRRAAPLLNRAYDLLQRRANAISNPMWQHTYLENIQVNHALALQWELDNLRVVRGNTAAPPAAASVDVAAPARETA